MSGDLLPPRLAGPGYYRIYYAEPVGPGGVFDGPFDDVPEMARATEMHDYPSDGYVVWMDEHGNISSVPSLNPDDLLTERDIEAVWEGYIECAVWANPPYNEEGTEELDFDEVDLSSLKPAVTAFVEANAADFDLYVAAYRPVGGFDPAECFGHDLWLTQNHHGAGFWDRGLGELGERLTVAAHAEGSVYLYLDADGIVRGE